MKDYFKDLTPKEKNIIQDKGTEPLFLESIMIFMKTEFLFAELAILLCINPIQNLILVVGGLHLMMKLVVQLQDTKTDHLEKLEQKFAVLNAKVI